MVNRALAALTAVSLLGACQAQTTARIFQWAFQSNSVSSTLGSCQELGIMVTQWPNYSGNSSGVPPYYMRAWEQGGSVRTTLLGSDEDDLKWIVNNPVGSKLLLNVIDSNDSSGGVAPKLFTIETGSTTNCVLDGSDTNFKVSSNVSSSDILQACQPWGLRIDGGVPPYNISLAQVNSPVITNVTTNQDDDAYTYINRADGNKLMMASVVDSTGRIAYGTPSIMTADQTDIDCGTLISTSGNSTELDAAAAAERAASGKSNRTGIIVGVVLGVIALLLLAGGGFWWWYRRRRHTQNNTEIDPDMMPTPYMSGQVLSINAFTSQQPSQPYSPKSPYGHTTDSTTHFDPYQMVNSHNPTSSSSRPTSSQSQAPSQSSISERPATFSNFPLVPVRRSKAAEAGVPNGSTDDSESSGSGRPPMERSQSTSASAYPSVSSHHHDTRPMSVSTRASFAPTGEREIIYQHRDGGVVRELPPPYADRARLGLADGDS